MIGEAATLITAASGVIIGILGWVLNRRRAYDERQSSLIDDLEVRTKALTQEVTASTLELRAAADYIVLLRSTLIENGIEVPPWPPELSGR